MGSGLVGIRRITPSANAPYEKGAKAISEGSVRVAPLLAALRAAANGHAKVARMLKLLPSRPICDALRYLPRSVQTKLSM